MSQVFCYRKSPLCRLSADGTNQNENRGFFPAKHIISLAAWGIHYLLPPGPPVIPGTSVTWFEELPPGVPELSDGEVGAVEGGVYESFPPGP